MPIEFREDMYKGEPLHPQCCFFEAFASSPDPDETFYGFFACHMSGEEKHAEVCKGDYVLCPLAYGKSRLTKRALDARKRGAKSIIQIKRFCEVRARVTQTVRWLLCKIVFFV